MDKVECCIPFILQNIGCHRQKHADDPNLPPFFLGVNGVQGAGKTTLVSSLASILRGSPFLLPTVVFSIDDLYLPHSLQTHLANTHATNPLIRHRGLPSTHDVALGVSVFSLLRNGNAAKIPRYDKSAFDGSGDRVSQELWETVNLEGKPRVKVAIFEGWCVGFRALHAKELTQKWEEAVKHRKEGGYQGRLGWNQLENLEFVNEALKEYDKLTDQLDALIHIDAESTHFVYEWRLEQESALRISKGAGMTSEQVIEFVNGYYPAYELFTDQLRAGIFGGEQGKQLRLVVGRDRRVKKVMAIPGKAQSAPTS